MRYPIKFRLMIIILLLSFAATGVFAQNGSKILTLDDYPRWKHIVSTKISPDGNWVTYAYRPNAADDTLHIKNMKTGKVYDIPGGSTPSFSEDSKWAAYMINLPKVETEKLKKEKKKITKKAETVNLDSGIKHTIDNASAFAFSKTSGFLAVKKAKSDDKAGFKGTDLILINLDNGIYQNIGNVSEFAFNKPGEYLAYSVDAANRIGNGIYLIDLESGAFNSLDTDTLSYSGLAWDEKGKTGVAVLKGRTQKGNEHRDNRLVLAFLTAGRNKRSESIAVSRVIDPKDFDTFPENMIISENGSLSWNEDGTMVFFGIREQKKKLKKSDEKVANVDVWHWKDKRIQSHQMIRADRDKKLTYRSVFITGTSELKRLADENMKTITISPDGKWGVGAVSDPYISDKYGGGGEQDFYSVNNTTGDRTLIAEKVFYSYGISPDSKHFLYWKNRDYFLYSFESGRNINISENAPVNFENMEFDRPMEKSPYRIAGWSKDGRSVLVYHRYDIYMLSLEGKTAENITKDFGDKNEIVFRYFRLDPEEKSIDLKRSLFLTASGQWTKKTGFFSLKAGKEPQQLVYEDKRFGRPVKAKKADKLLYTVETFIEYPDYFTSGTNMKDRVRITNANPQQIEYAWGRNELIDFTDSRGNRLQASLTYPANYEPGKKYPMLVYYYEKMSQRVHVFSKPVYDDRPHMSLYASNGYLVLMPDIEYEMGKPGSSAMDCVTSAVKKVIEFGYADPERVGLQGHSWGGYETAFMITQPHIFRYACAVAGAAASELFSDFNQVYKRTGTNNRGYHETSQGRIGTNPWEAQELYISQSPLQNVRNINAPFMLLHGTVDGAVDWIQGLVYYNAARYWGKEVIFLSYPDEPHHLRKLENQKDFLKRMQDFFDVYLKGKPAPDWMINGLPYLEKEYK